MSKREKLVVSGITGISVGISPIPPLEVANAGSSSSQKLNLPKIKSHQMTLKPNKMERNGSSKSIYIYYAKFRIRDA